MLNKRIFISIDLPSKIKEKIIFIKKEFNNLPIVWQKEDKLHLTVIFLGLLNEERAEMVSNILEDLVKNKKKFQLKIKNISFEPEGKEKANMIWGKLVDSKELSLFRKEVIKKMKENNFLISEEYYNFSPHITIGKIKRSKWKMIETEELPEIEEEINLTFNVEKISLIESILKKDGSDYNLLKEFYF